MPLDPTLRLAVQRELIEEVIGFETIDKLKERIVEQYNSGGALHSFTRLKTPRSVLRKLRKDGTQKVDDALETIFTEKEGFEYIMIGWSQGLLPHMELSIRLLAPQSR